MLARVFDQYCPDRILRDREEPPLGAGRVVHCGAVSRLLPRGPVEEVSLSCFSRGRPIAVRAGGPAGFGALEVIQRARSRVGEDRYRLLTNNCEHLCEWCLHGRRRSYQVERLARPLGVLQQWLTAWFRYKRLSAAWSFGPVRGEDQQS